MRRSGFFLSTDRQKVQARSAVPFAVKLLAGFFVDGTWNVPTTLTFVGSVNNWIGTKVSILD